MTTSTDDAVWLALALAHETNGDPELKCHVGVCPKVALYELKLQRPCEHAPYYYCEEHTQQVRQENTMPTVRAFGWKCEEPPKGCGAFLGRLLHIEPIKRG